MASNTWIELDLGILQRNLRALRDALPGETQIIFVVKANAYGHGMLPAAKQAWSDGVKWFAVAHIDEAVELRAALPGAEIIIVGAMDSAAVETAIAGKLTPMIVSDDHAKALAAAASAARKTLRCHAKIDTGMGRLGFAWEEAPRLLSALAKRGGLDISGICTHFASSGSPKRTFVDIQAVRFCKTVTACQDAGLNIPFRHVANSGAILGGTDCDFDGVRPGILLYGYGPRLEPGRQVPAQPFLQWKTRLVQVKKVASGFPVSYDSTHVTLRPTHIGTLDVGYADGYSRLLSNKGFVLVEGQRKPIAGRVTMNLTAVDLGPTTNAKPGDEAVLLGQQGNAAIGADEIADWRGTISYEVLTNIHTTDRRVKTA